MKTATALLLLVVFSICLVDSTHLVVGNIADRVILAHHEKFVYNAFPFFKRIKNFFYSSPRNKPIRGIQALDMDHSQASVNITAGGVGYPFVNLRIKSERGRGINYDIGVYENTDFI